MPEHKSKRIVKAKLMLSLHGVTVEINIPSGLGPFAERCRQAFVANSTNTTSADGGFAPESAAEIVVDFISYLGGQSSRNSKSRAHLLQLLWKHLEQKILADNDIHVYAAAELDNVIRRQRLISRFYAAQDETGVSRYEYTSAMLRARKAGRAHIYGIFGGQGNTREYLEELRTLNATYKCLITDLIEACGNRLLELSVDARVSDQYPSGLDVVRWIEDPYNTPSTDYLIRAPVSFPLIGLVQLCYVKSLITSLGGSPADLASAFSGLSGHSQGAVVATVLATVVTWEDFTNAALDAVTILFWIGARSQQVFRQTPLPEEKSASLIAAGLGTPGPMLSVTNIRLTELQATVESVNSHLAPASRMVVALINRDDAFVLSGPERTLAALVDALDGLGASQPQSRVAFSQRKMTPRTRFLPITIPCHSHLLQDAVRLIDEDLKKAGVTLTKNIRLPVNRTSQSDFATICGSADMVPFLVRAITTDPVNWRDADFPSATHIVDFGPGGTSGVGALSMDNLSGSGARVIIAGRPGLQIPDHPDMGSMVELYDRRDESLGWSISWPKEFAPSLLRFPFADKPQINSRMSRLLGLPPVMIAGMTPTTIHPDFVAAAMRAGYHVEFACGGYASPAKLRAAILNLTHLLPAGRGITLNVIYASPKTLAWQIPLIRRLRTVDQLPITGLTVGGGVPSVEVATEYINTLGIEHLSLKPGSVASILQAIEIARQNPNFPIILQWTGGRGGGHHSFEDFHAPILETYPRIRQCPNIILVAGSGFADAEDAYPYLWGSWSLLHGRHTRMPFDGVLCGSRVMACREAHTSPAAKAAIAACPGLADQDWEGTYKPQGAGGIVSITSEMGEPMHVVATRGALLWAELDRSVFSVPRGPKRISKLQYMHDNLITRLNADFQKPWFACRYQDETSCAVACELGDMTYAHVARRILELCCFRQAGKAPVRWIDTSYADLLSNFLIRTQERFLDNEHLGECQDPSDLHNACKVDPSATVASVMNMVSEANTTQLYIEDVHYFVTQLCRLAGMKPVPFVPALDNDFETWFKKDSLWQSENLEAVGRDAGRVLILQGPVATRGLRTVDEPVSEVLDGINNGIVERLLVESYRNDVHSVPVMEHLPRLSLKSTVDGDANIYEESDAEVEDDIKNKEGPLNGDALRLALVADGGDQTWRQALFETRQIYRGKKLVENPLWTLTESIWAERVEFVEQDGTSIIRVLGAPETIRRGPIQQEVILAQIEKPAKSNKITASAYTWVTENTQGVHLDIRLEYHPESPYSLIREEPGSREQELYRMYRQLWHSGAVKEKSGWFEEQFEIQEERVRAFNKAVGYSEAHQTEIVPMDFSIVASWGTVCRALLQEPVKGDLLRLVHLSNSYEFANPAERAESVKFGDVVTARAKQDHVEKVRGPDGNVSGCEVGVICHLSSATGRPIMSVRSRFLIRGQPEGVSDETFFNYTKHSPFEVALSTVGDFAILRSNMQSWLAPEQSKEEMLSNLLTPEIGQTTKAQITLEFHLETHSHKSIDTKGGVYLRSDVGLVQIGRVASSVSAQVNCPVLSYLSEHGRGMNQPTHLEKPIPYPTLVGQVKVPYSNETYSRASGDYNPIHTSRQFAALAGNNGNTITHGMYCSAVVRQAVERHAAGQCPERILRYETKFVDMVLPGDVLDVALSHVAMLDGEMVVDIVVSRQARSDDQGGAVVITGTAIVTQPPTALLFTGQGSQESNMGMDLYESSPVARAVWDEAEQYLQANLGLSLLQIVRQNPKSIKVHFGGARGAALREKYMAAETEGEPIFPTINRQTTHYTHSGPAGLLFTTQFSQLAITVMELAAFRDMCASGVVDIKRCKFAGHSLGEYGALAAMTDVLPLQKLLPMVIARGMTMQKAVERDGLGRSAFGMVAVDPSRVFFSDSSKTPLSHAQLTTVVADIARGTGLLLEIVNLNIKGSQYVCAGELRALGLLQKVLDAANNCSSQHLSELVTKHVSELDATATEKSKTSLRLVRGAATIPLAGIDVPFHSSHIKPRMNAFRVALEAAIRPERVHSEQLVGRYVPNVTGKPFNVSKESFEEALAATGSEKLRDVVQGWEKWAERKRIEKQRQMARV